MYDPTDPRSALATAAPSRTVALDTPIAAPAYTEFDEAPQIDDERSGRTRAVRGAGAP